MKHEAGMDYLNCQTEGKGMGTIYIFQIKKDRVFCARLVAMGYNQQAGIDFACNYATLLNEVTFRVILVAWIGNN